MHYLKLNNCGCIEVINFCEIFNAKNYNTYIICRLINHTTADNKNLVSSNLYKDIT